MLKRLLLTLLLIGNVAPIIYAQQNNDSDGQLPDKIILALQPHDAQKFQDKAFDDNILVRLARALNVDIEIYTCPWVRCLLAIQKGHADVIDDLFYSPDRETFTYFLQPHFDQQTAGFRFYANNTRTPAIENWEQLYHLRIGMLRAYKHFPRFDQDPRLNKQDFIDVNVIAKMILKDRLDVFIAPPSFDEESFSQVDTEKKLRRQPLAHIETLPLYIGLSRRSDWFQHKAHMEKALATILTQ